MVWNYSFSMLFASHSASFNDTSQSNRCVRLAHPIFSPPPSSSRHCLRVGFLCGFVYRMQPLLEAIRAGFPHYLPVITERWQLYGNAGPSPRAERKEHRGFTIKDNGTRTHTHARPDPCIRGSPLRNHFNVRAVPSLCKCQSIKDCAHHAGLWMHFVRTGWHRVFLSLFEA